MLRSRPRSQEDFTSISRVGDSVKKTQIGKTGRFGIGFNSVYHLTDVPSFGALCFSTDRRTAYLPRCPPMAEQQRVFADQ